MEVDRRVIQKKGKTKGMRNTIDDSKAIKKHTVLFYINYSCVFLYVIYLSEIMTLEMKILPPRAKDFLTKSSTAKHGESSV